MRFAILGNIKNNIYNMMRDAGYHFQREDNEAAATEYSFVRPRRGFPRFHVYAKPEKEGFLINLHLDQKKPLYQGATAHMGDYDEPVVAKEAERIKRMLQNSAQ